MDTKSIISQMPIKMPNEQSKSPGTQSYGMVIPHQKQMRRHIPSSFSVGSPPLAP